jgi:hypothetical protein
VKQVDILENRPKGNKRVTSRHFTPRNTCASYHYGHKHIYRPGPTAHPPPHHPTHTHTVVYQLSLCYCIFISWLPNLTDTYSTPFPHSSPPTFSSILYICPSSHQHLDSLAYTNIVRQYLIISIINYHNGRSLQLNFQLLGSAVSFCTDGPSTCSRSG